MNTPASAGPKNVEDDEEKKRREAAARRRQERISMCQLRMASTRPPATSSRTSSSPRITANRKTIWEYQGLKSSVIQKSLAGSNPVAIQKDVAGAFAFGYPSTVLQSAQLVTEKERMEEGMVFDECEEKKIQEETRKATEDKIRSKMPVAETNTLEQIKRCRIRNCYPILFVLFLCIIGAVIGGTFALMDDKSSSLGTQSVIVPTNAPTPLESSNVAIETCEGAQDITKLMGKS